MASNPDVVQAYAEIHDGERRDTDGPGPTITTACGDRDCEKRTDSAPSIRTTPDKPSRRCMGVNGIGDHGSGPPVASCSSPWDIATSTPTVHDEEAALRLLSSVRIVSEPDGDEIECKSSHSSMQLHSGVGVEDSILADEIEAQEEVDDLHRSFTKIRDSMCSHNAPPVFPDTYAMVEPTPRQKYYSEGRRPPARGQVVMEPIPHASARVAGFRPETQRTCLRKSNEMSRGGSSRTGRAVRSSSGPSCCMPNGKSTFEATSAGKGQISSDPACPLPNDASDALGARHKVLAKHAALLSTSGFVPTPGITTHLFNGGADETSSAGAKIREDTCCGRGEHTRPPIGSHGHGVSPVSQANARHDYVSHTPQPMWAPGTFWASSSSYVGVATLPVALPEAAMKSSRRSPSTYSPSQRMGSSSSHIGQSAKAPERKSVEEMRKALEASRRRYECR
eukprot:scaffold20056_cov33-Tisochrysis_lutea.AAC.5